MVAAENKIMLCIKCMCKMHVIALNQMMTMKELLMRQSNRDLIPRYIFVLYFCIFT